MIHLRRLGIAAAVAVVSVVFVASASATTLTSPTGTATTPTTHGVNENGFVKISNPIANIECNVTYEANNEKHGAGVTDWGIFIVWQFSSCPNWHVTIVALGIYETHWTSGYNGRWTFTGWKFDATRLGVTCVYETNNTSMGTITGGNPATINLEASIPLNTSESSGLCGAGNAKMEGNLVTTSALYIDS